MAKVRAYKIAEELGVDRNELVEKAKEFGIELKSAMAGLEEAEVALLREKLGTSVKKGEVVESRIERKGGAAVIRRRKRAVPEPEPVPEPVVEVPEPVVATAPPEAPLGEEPAVVEPEPEAAPEPAQPTALATQPAATSSPKSAPGKSAPEPERKKQRKQFREVVNLREQEQIARQATGRSMTRRPVMVDPRGMASPRRRRRDALNKPAKPAAATPIKRVVRVEGEVSVGELAKQLGAKAAEVQGKLMALGIMVSINQTIDTERAGRVASEYGFEILDVGFNEAEFLGTAEKDVDESKLEPRPPIITVMGHVDHGKTSLLDAIRKTNVVASEAGGITQHIGAYQVVVDDKRLTFIDTPGHEAFTAMRARGAQATDLVILVVAATDGVMPQTVEAIDHARAAGVPIVMAVNKIDLPGADPQQVRQRIMEHNLVPEEFGGDLQSADVSATKGTGFDELLEKVGLQAELLELKADPTCRAAGVVLEAQLESGRGPVATVLVREGTLRRGDVLVAGSCWGKVRALQNEQGDTLESAGPSTPVQVIGLPAVPEAGANATVVESERVAKDIVAHRQAKARAKPSDAKPKLTLEEFFALQEGGGVKDLRVLLKADTHGSVEAIRDGLLNLSTDAVKVDVISSGVGAITENDITFARASEAIVVGFHVRPDPAGRKAAESTGVDVRHYKVIYDVLDEMRLALVGLLPPTIKEVVLGHAEVRETFVIPRQGTIAGSYLTDGFIRRGAACRLMRDSVQVYEGRVGSLRRFKEDVREVQTGFECGIDIEGYNDVKVGDEIEIYELREEPAEL